MLSKLNIMKSEEKLEIKTFGHFSVKKGNRLISEECSKSQRLWNLFQYILTFRDKHIVQEDFFDILWTDRECNNPLKALQNLVYRLRSLLDQGLVSYNGASLINFSQRCYSWNCNINYWLDADEFEELCSKGIEAYKNKDFNTAIDLYQKALCLYKGDYLEEYSNCEWIIPARNYYKRLYLNSVINLAHIYKLSEKYQKIIALCEKILFVEPLEEELHIYFIEALIEEGRIKQARNHYEYITSILYKEMGVKPSAGLRNLYRRIKANDSENSIEINLKHEDFIDIKNTEGAFYCEPDFFKSLYNLETHRIERTGKAIFVAMVTLSSRKHEISEKNALQKGLELLLEIFIKNLRKGDVITKWSESQIAILLTELTFEQAEKVINRARHEFDTFVDSKDIIINTKLQNLNYSNI